MRALRFVPGLASIAALGLTFAAAAPAADRQPAGPVDGGYIVVFAPSTSDPGGKTTGLERKHGFKARHRYSRALKGFAARLNEQQRARLAAEPGVASFTPDRRVRATATLATGDTAPTGVRRIGAASGTTVRDASGVNVAVIDTGIDLAHPDLNATSGKNCITAGAAAQDDEGHGTHVAGTIAARNNGAGVVGVAPGTKLFAVKVLDAAGSGTMSQVICGIDWVTSTRTDADTTNDVKVANMSLGGPGSPIASCATTTDPEHKAICNATAAGVTFVVAAGNDGWDFDYASQPDTPAAYPEVLTVSALSDSDGRSGATGGAPTCRSGEADDRYASFSNFAATSAGQAHTIAAPGTCITSTARGGGQTVMSGTSMASPHMAGVVALCFAEGATAGPCAGLTPAQVVQKMRSDAQAFNTTNTGYGFNGDPLRPVSGRYYGHLTWAGTTSTAPAPAPVTVSSAPARVTRQLGSLRSGSVSSLSAADSSYYQLNSTTSATRSASWYGTFTGVPTTLRNLKVTYRGKNSLTCNQAVWIWNAATGAWNQLDARSVGTTEVLIERTPTGTLSNYVYGGELHVRVSCSAGSSFFTSANLLRISYEK